MGEDGEQRAEWMELPNGCICCSVRSDLVRAVEYLVEKSDKFEYVLVETDGLARPGPVAAAFWVDEELESRTCSRFMGKVPPGQETHSMDDSTLFGWYYHGRGCQECPPAFE